jgi:hypothetical protein
MHGTGRWWCSLPARFEYEESAVLCSEDNQTMWLFNLVMQKQKCVWDVWLWTATQDCYVMQQCHFVSVWTWEVNCIWWGKWQETCTLSFCLEIFDKLMLLNSASSAKCGTLWVWLQSKADKQNHECKSVLITSLSLLSMKLTNLEWEEFTIESISDQKIYHTCISQNFSHKKDRQHQ